MQLSPDFCKTAELATNKDAVLLSQTKMKKEKQIGAH